MGQVMATGNFVAYYRVSTDKQGKSGLGLEAQKTAVESFLNGGCWKLVRSYTEIESGRNNERPQLAAATKACRVYGAKLVIAKLDRLSRDAHFLLGLEKAGVDFVAADMPHANRLTVRVMALVAEQEAKAISDRTKAALAAAKARGVKLGGFRAGAKVTAKMRRQSILARSEAADARSRDLAPIIAEIQEQGATSLREIAAALTDRGIPMARGGTEWTAMAVSRVLNRAK
jgi:DNA invertase Pin-like site-specific DNA recombinase